MQTIINKNELENVNIPSIDPLLKIQAVVKITTLSKSTIHRMIKNGSFPKPFKPAQNRRYWVLSQIKRWQAEHIFNA